MIIIIIDNIIIKSIHPYNNSSAFQLIEVLHTHLHINHSHTQRVHIKSSTVKTLWETFPFYWVDVYVIIIESTVTHIMILTTAFLFYTKIFNKFLISIKRFFHKLFIILYSYLKLFCDFSLLI